MIDQLRLIIQYTTFQKEGIVCQNREYNFLLLKTESLIISPFLFQSFTLVVQFQYRDTGFI